MFFKALVLALWAALGAAWTRYKVRRRALGIELRPDKRGVYVPHDPIERFERWVKAAFYGLSTAFAIYGAFVLYVLFSDAGVF